MLGDSAIGNPDLLARASHALSFVFLIPQFHQCRGFGILRFETGHVGKRPIEIREGSYER